jgi:peptide-methionine (R)-S-oxide reductase
MMKYVSLILFCLIFFQACAQPVTKNDDMSMINDSAKIQKIEKSDEEWRKILSEEEYYILRQKGTERAFTGKYWNTEESGKYYCAGCNLYLFDAETKFESGCGWPSFFAPADKIVISEKLDKSFGMIRREVLCARCDGHLGHVFEDGPKPTGLRYCINSGAIKFVKD